MARGDIVNVSTLGFLPTLALVKNRGCRGAPLSAVAKVPILPSKREVRMRVHADIFKNVYQASNHNVGVGA